MGKQILIDSDELEHLLNCMAQLDFLPLSGMHADEAIVRQAYLKARETLTRGINDPCAFPPNSQPPIPLPDPGEEAIGPESDDFNEAPYPS